MQTRHSEVCIKTFHKGFMSSRLLKKVDRKSTCPILHLLFQPCSTGFNYSQQALIDFLSTTVQQQDSQEFKKRQIRIPPTIDDTPPCVSH